MSEIIGGVEGKQEKKDGETVVGSADHGSVASSDSVGNDSKVGVAGASQESGRGVKP